MTDTIEYENPFFYLDLNKPEITYNKDYPYVEYENQILSGGIEESNNKYIINRSKKKNIKISEINRFLF